MHFPHLFTHRFINQLSDSVTHAFSPLFACWLTNVLLTFTCSCWLENTLTRPLTNLFTCSRPLMHFTPKRWYFSFPFPSLLFGRLFLFFSLSVTLPLTPTFSHSHSSSHILPLPLSSLAFPPSLPPTLTFERDVFARCRMNRWPSLFNA